MVMGLFFVGVSYLAFVDGGREAFLHVVRRPGPALLFFAALFGVTAVIAGSGSVEDSDGPRWEVTLTLLTSRLLPAVILTVLATGAAMLGLYEIVAPEGFDAMGGSFLELLFAGSASLPVAKPRP